MIRDLLWACVICGEEEALRVDNRVETCSACGAQYRRTKGAHIAIAVQGRGVETRTAAEWSSQLPPVSPSGKAECLVRAAESELSVRGYGEYLGRVEKFGNFHFGDIELSDTALKFTAREGDHSFEWPLRDITAVQPSSTALQIKASGRPVVSIKFVNSSSRLWEERLHVALRKHYSGREVIDFQPRISVR